ncbi:MAG: hypothetical protein ABR577_00065 [Pyrinomonadaceae bacterium]
MTIQSSLTFLRRRNPIALMFVLSGTIALAAVLGSLGLSKAQSTSQERVLENRIPPHLPIKIKVKNLQNENVLRDLEIEVTNKSNKPIYYLKISVMLPEMLSPNGFPLGYMLRYGRPELIDLLNEATPADVPLKPGESYVFKIPESNVRGWERFATERNLSKSEPKKIVILTHMLNFGDGTGFDNTGAEPMDVRSKKKLAVAPPQESRDGVPEQVERQFLPKRLILPVRLGSLQNPFFLTFVARVHPAET